MNVIATMGIVITVLVFILIAVVKIALKERKEKLAYKSEAERKTNTIDYLYKHFEEVEKIKAEENKTEQELKDAKTDEEVLDIVRAVANRNNDKLRDKTKKGN